jgi:poly(3-hydroxybutyrate) depolymerase
VGYAAGTLHLSDDAPLLLLLGADDGVRVLVDGKSTYARDESRPQRDDDDIVPLELAKGDHSLVLALHQHDAAWALHVRLLDARTLAPPKGAYLALPGTTLLDAKALAAKMSWVSVDRGLAPDGYHPQLSVRFPEGAPRGIPLSVRARLVRAGPANRSAWDPAVEALFDVDAGQVPSGGDGAFDLKVTLPTVGDLRAPVDDVDWNYEVRVADRTVTARFAPRRTLRAAVARTSAALAAVDRDAPWLVPGSLESVRHEYDRVVSFGSHSDGDLEGELDEAKELDALARALEQKNDPYKDRTGPMRRAYLSPIDAELAEFGLYVPSSYLPGNHRRYPLVVGLHGLNGRPMAMIRYLFGFDDPKKENEWEDRHLGALPPLDAFVVTPHTHGNTMGRDMGEDDVMRVVDWAEKTYPIDPDRVTITGMSMGGIASAAVALRHPDRFAAAEPLCGYHSYFVRRDVAGHPIRPWERILAEERSNVSWAYNGEHLPLFIVHGTLDLPEENSGVLIKRYQDLGYSVEHEHPVLGHNVWQTTYEGFKGIDWLLPHRRDAHPAEVRFRTLRLRDADDAWVHLDELRAPDAWGEIEARMHSRKLLVATTKGIAALHFDRDPQLTDPRGPLTVSVDGENVHFAADEPVALHLDGSTWKAGPAAHAAPYKHGEVTGPIRDAYHAPLLFVYGADDPTQTRANKEVARAWAADGWGIVVHYPVMSDAEFFAQGEPLANDRALFLIGNAKSNRVVRALEPELPIRVDGGAVTMGSQRVEGTEVGAAFVVPNPRRPDRYVVVVEGADAPGTWRSLSLPSLLPDFVVYDVKLAPARGQMLLGAGSVRAAGFFKNDWSLPEVIADPLATAKRVGAKTEYEATPYLP